jgi:hypothetical protein
MDRLEHIFIFITRTSDFQVVFLSSNPSEILQISNFVKVAGGVSNSMWCAHELATLDPLIFNPLSQAEADWQGH